MAVVRRGNPSTPATEPAQILERAIQEYRKYG
jgi:hypothetical protein